MRKAAIVQAISQQLPRQMWVDKRATEKECVDVLGAKICDSCEDVICRWRISVEEEVGGVGQPH